MASQEYWKNRETEAKKHNIQEEAEYNRKIKEIYANMMDEINKEINGFYTKYAAKEGITMAEAKKRVSKLDIAAYERKAKKYVETKDLSDRANEEMRIYNLTMKVNRLELLKANIGLVKKSLLTSSEYRKKFNQVSGNSKVNRRAWNISKDMLSHRSGTKFEDLAFINVVNGKYAVNKDYDVESKANMNKQMKQLLEESEPKTIIAIHNHPGSSVPSLADLMTCVNRGYYLGLVVCHDGKVYKYWVDKNKFNSVNAGFALDRMETQGYDKEVRTWLEQAGVYMEVW